MLLSRTKTKVTERPQFENPASQLIAMELIDLVWLMSKFWCISIGKTTHCYLFLWLLKRPRVALTGGSTLVKNNWFCLLLLWLYLPIFVLFYLCVKMIKQNWTVDIVQDIAKISTKVWNCAGVYILSWDPKFCSLWLNSVGRLQIHDTPFIARRIEGQ